MLSVMCVAVFSEVPLVLEFCKKTFSHLNLSVIHQEALIEEVFVHGKDFLTYAVDLCHFPGDIKSYFGRLREKSLIFIIDAEKIVDPDLVNRHNIRALVSKEDRVSSFCSAVENVLNGERYVSRTIYESYQATFPNELAFSKREKEILYLLGSGYRPGKIAEILCRSVKTVDTYKTRLIEKLGLADSDDLYVHAVSFQNRYIKVESLLGLEEYD